MYLRCTFRKKLKILDFLYLLFHNMFRLTIFQQGGGRVLWMGGGDNLAKMGGIGPDGGGETRVIPPHPSHLIKPWITQSLAAYVYHPFLAPHPYFVTFLNWQKGIILSILKYFWPVAHKAFNFLLLYLSPPFPISLRKFITPL